MEDKCLCIALVGFRGMAARFRRRYMEIPGARLALMIGTDPEALRKAAEELGVERWSVEFADALGSEIDMVDISTPNHLHREQAVAAMQAGKHILLQKPIAPNVEDADAIVETARRTGVTAGMYMSMFDNPLFYDLKKLLAGGHLGRVSAVHCRGAYRSGLTMKPSTWRGSRRQTGGGSFIQLAIHPINMAQWLLDERIVRVAAFSGNLMCPNVGGDDVTSAACEFKSGIQGTLSSGYASCPNLLAIYGTKGYVSVTDENRLDILMDEAYTGETIRYERPGKIETIQYAFDVSSLCRDPNPYDQHVAFVRALLEGKPAPISLEAGLYDLQIVEAVYRASAEKRVVEVE